QQVTMTASPPSAPRRQSMPRRAMLAAAVLVFGAAVAPAADKAVTLSGKEIYQRTLKSTVFIAYTVELSGGRVALAMGSGSVIDVPGRLILTNFHVVGEEKEVRVFFPQFDKQNKLIASKEVYIQQLRSGRGLRG